MNVTTRLPLADAVIASTPALNTKAPTENLHRIEVDIVTEEAIGITNSAQSLIDVDYVSTVPGNSHPTAVTETACLSSVPLPQPTYRLLLPAETTNTSTGSLSDTQLETITLICQHQEHVSADGTRPAALIADCHGFGKGRIASGVIFENHLRDPNFPAIWISDSWDKVEEVVRDLMDIGSGDQIPVYSLKDISLLPKEKNGVLFCTYASLTSKAQMKKVTEWCGSGFSGVLVFDECQNAKGISQTQKAESVQKLIEHAQESRILFVSASGLSEPNHLEYLNRIELWSGANKVFQGILTFI